ncbi:NPC intracellular cholesterol transporter 1 homolog 1b-like [Aricia agestis]|uniref:NPC intracellular cholesterol transporter 1 homolog 1b-like n=1 Tax=Aricia agestis TaxID=91739 RepID=UPI001C20390A|nr:NPC intracellular cholesterol transporter 1 homolog 1b-like [Aricia agestis]
MKKINFSAVLILSLSFLCCVSAKCVMYDECAEVGGFMKPCPYNDDAPSLLQNLSEEDRAEVLRIVETRCPFLLYDAEGNRLADNDITTCCSRTQLVKMEESLLLADSILGRCPRCLRNFARQICEMNCSPDQARFVDVEVETDGNGIDYVNVINYRMHEDFMVNAHNSCAGVIVPQTGMPAINLMCGNAPVCDADAWFGFSGDQSVNPLAPVQVNFLRMQTEENSMNAEAPLCYETEEGDIPCSCIDCIATCPTGNEPSLPDICTVFSVNCIGFSMGIVWFAISVTIFTALAMVERKRLQNATLVNDGKKYKFKVNKVTRFFQKVFGVLGAYSAGSPVLVLMLSSWVVIYLCMGIFEVNMTSSPLELWSDPESRSRQELNYFNSRFGPFYRASQVFLTVRLDGFTVDNTTYGPAYRVEAIEELIKLEDAIMNIGRDSGGVKLENVCFAPLRARDDEEKLSDCTTMSVGTYFPSRVINNETYLTQIQNCLNNYLSFGCIAEWGGGADPEIVVGGYEDNILMANTLLLNFPITNKLNAEELEPVMEWEKHFIDLMHDYQENWKSDFIDVAFGAERSIEDEIQRVSEAEAIPIAISYILMFIYVILALGNIRSLKSCLTEGKISVAIASIFVVLMAIACALGSLGYAGVTITLLAVNVIPFFILSVGVDNVFLMVNTLQDIENNLKDDQDYNENFTFEKRKSYVFSKMMSQIGPSMFVSSVTQITCFAIGTLANFPAVRTFALFATVSLGMLFVFQITTVVAILAIDYKRSKQNRFDVFCCIRRKVLNDEQPLQDGRPYQSVTRRLMTPYAKYLLNWKVKFVLSLLFMTFLSICIILIPQIEVGLDQEMALPKDSYVYKYLVAVNELMVLGPPIYFVLKGGLDFTDPEHQNVICGSQMCRDDSLTTQVFLATQYRDITYISRSSNSWLDDFFDWATLTNSCCKYNVTDGSFCPSTSNSLDCVYCTIDRGDYANGLRPGSEAFYKYIPFFLQDEPNDVCTKGGLASYYNNVNYVLDSEGRAIVQDTNFMAYHSTIVTSQDYISAVRNGYEISESITAVIREQTGTDVEVFPYSVFYVYFEQYLTMWEDTFLFISYCLIGTFIINLIATGFNVLISLALIICVFMIIVEMMGIMYMWNIPLNAVSCINLIVSIGISVEFCSHIAYAYATSEAPPKDKIADALKRVGGTVITGITFTNIPIIVLAFSYTEIIEVFFFRMLFSLVILGFLHGMVFFPVLLSYINDIKYR